MVGGDDMDFTMTGGFFISRVSYQDCMMIEGLSVRVVYKVATDLAGQHWPILLDVHQSQQLRLGATALPHERPIAVVHLLRSYDVKERTYVYVFHQRSLHLKEHSRAEGEAHAKLFEGLWISLQTKESGPAGRNAHHLISPLGIGGIKQHWMGHFVIHDVIVERQMTFVEQ